MLKEFMPGTIIEMESNRFVVEDILKTYNLAGTLVRHEYLTTIMEAYTTINTTKRLFSHDQACSLVIKAVYRESFLKVEKLSVSKKTFEKICSLTFLMMFSYDALAEHLLRDIDQPIQAILMEGIYRAGLSHGEAPSADLVDSVFEQFKVIVEFLISETLKIKGALHLNKRAFETFTKLPNYINNAEPSHPCASYWNDHLDRAFSEYETIEAIQDIFKMQADVVRQRIHLRNAPF